MTRAINIAQSGGNNFTMRNRIINGDMRIDQRNAGAAVTANQSVYFVDRWVTLATQTSKATVQQSTTAPAGFGNSFVYTSSSAYSVLSTDYFGFAQQIEGNNMIDFAWGTSSAATVTLSFWVRSSLTGTFGGSLRNNAGDRSYPFTYTITAANTWEQKSITIAGDTSGSWPLTNGIGIRVLFGMGMGSNHLGTAGSWASANYLGAIGQSSVVGTNGATFYITGVQLEAGSTATPFENRPIGTELALCQRYFFTTYPQGTALGTAAIYMGARTAYCIDTGSLTRSWPLNALYAVTMRTNPLTLTVYDPNTGASGYVREYSSNNLRAISNINSGGNNGPQGMLGYVTLTTSENALQPVQFHIAADSEL